MTDEPGGRTKWMALLESSADRDLLQSLGSRMTPELLLETLEWASQQSHDRQQRLLPVIASVPQKVFAEGFGPLTASHMQVLKRLAAEEPIQHHLTLLAHSWAHDAEEQAKQLEQLRRQIASYDVREASQRDHEAFRKSIDTILHHFHQGVLLLDKALALAWNTSREDLIDRLTTLKENWLRYISEVLGYPAHESESATGVYKELDAHFNLVFGNIADPNELAALEDSDPGIEALAALSVWNAQDFHEVGLIGHGRQGAEDELLKVVQERLEKLGLRTVADFKRERIYSKRALTRYIGDRQI